MYDIWEVLALVFFSGLIWGAALNHLYIKYLVKKKKRLPKFLQSLGVEIKPTESPVIKNKGT